MIDTTDGRRNAHTIFRTCRRASDAGQLTTLARLSKAHWGYPREWLHLWEADLTITPETIDESIGYVA